MGHRCRKLLLLCVLSCFATTAIPAPGFVVSSKVRGGTNVAEISIQFACAVEYLGHFPSDKGDRVRIQIESTTLCNGAQPTIAYSRQQHRPLDADLAKLLELSYDGESSADQALTLAFTEEVSFDVDHRGTSNEMIIRVYPNKVVEPPPQESKESSTLVKREKEAPSSYVINLSSSRVQHAPSEMQAIVVAPELNVFESEVTLGDSTWFRLRVGEFATSAEAQVELRKLRAEYPTAWIDHADNPSSDGVNNDAPLDLSLESTNAVFTSVGLDQIDQLMTDARGAMVAGEMSRAVQIYTKVLRSPSSDRHAQAQEYLALAREKNGQKAHAKAEYQRFLSLYPNHEGATRVNQRLAALLASDRVVAKTAEEAGQTATARAARSASDWRIQTFFSQFYRRDVNQPNEQDDIVSQSALYSDINLDVRRRGKRFDFSSRLSAGYRNNFLEERFSSNNNTRVSYAYADLADPETGLRGRVGRQTRNTGGVLGRFDGLNIGYQLSDKILLNAVAGIPVNSASDDIDSERTFQGLSVNYGPILENLELGTYFITQDIEGIEDRTAVGTEMRYFGEKMNMWGLVDYDTAYNELGSAFLQGSWRITSRTSIQGSMDRRHSPYLSTRNAMIGQPVLTFADLLILFSEEEIRQFSVDRSPLSESATIGISQTISPKLQVNIDANQTTVAASPESGGIAATPESSFRYYSTTFVASSLLKEGDIYLISLRASDSETTKVMSLNLDSRFPLGRALRINPRLRVDRRQIMSDSSIEWLYTPGIRIQLRNSQKYRVQFEAGKRFSQRESELINLDRESYFVNLGYQVFF